VPPTAYYTQALSERLVLGVGWTTPFGLHTRWANPDAFTGRFVSQVAELTVADGKATGKRQTEFGYEVIEAPLPAIVAVSDAINEPRYPSLKGIMGAKSKPQETLTLSDVGVEAESVGEAGSKTEVYALADPPPRGDSIKIEDDGNGAARIVEFLAEKKFL